MPTIWVDNRIKGKLSYAWVATCQSPGHNKCEKNCDAYTTSRQGKLISFKPKAHSFYKTNFFI